MSRTRYVYRKNSETGEVEAFNVSEDFVGERRDGNHRSEEEVYGKVQATDGTDLSTRRRHREYMARNGLTIADDYKGEWEKAAKVREQAATPGAGYDRKERREQIGRALYAQKAKRR